MRYEKNKGQYEKAQPPKWKSVLKRTFLGVYQYRLASPGLFPYHEKDPAALPGHGVENKILEVIMASTRPKRLQTIRTLTGWAPERYAAMGEEVAACVRFIQSTPDCTYEKISKASRVVQEGYDQLIAVGGWLIHE